MKSFFCITVCLGLAHLPTSARAESPAGRAADQTAAAESDPVQARRQGNDAAKTAFKHGNSAEGLNALDATKDVRRKADHPAVQKAQRLTAIAIELVNEGDAATATLIAGLGREHASAWVGIPSKERAQLLYATAQLLEHTGAEPSEVRDIYAAALVQDSGLKLAEAGVQRMEARLAARQLKMVETDVLRKRAAAAAQKKVSQP